jgi:uncharacterized protein (DUF58 family)
MTSRGRIVLALAAGMYLAAWALGAQDAFLPSVGLALAVTLAVVYTRLIRGPFRLTRQSTQPRHVEGEALMLDVDVRVESGLTPACAALVDTLPGAGQITLPLTRYGDVLHGAVTLTNLARGRYRLDQARLLVRDPFGLAQTSMPLPAVGVMLVHPRISDLDRLFPDGGGHDGAAGRLLLSRGSGFDLHSVRDHQRGESLRRVHWRSTARRGRLMVKELEDAPRDEAAVLLDARSGLNVGSAPDSSFEMIVRAAGSLLRRLVAEGRRASLVVAGERVERYPVASLDTDWRAVLDMLAAVTPTATRNLAATLGGDHHGLDALRLFVVTSDLEPRLADRLLADSARRESAVVWVDQRTRLTVTPPTSTADAVAAGLARRGIPVAHLRRGDDLNFVLSTGTRPPVGVSA